jgi:hypothetical protein
MPLLRRKAEDLVLSGPFRRQVDEASNSDAMREPEPQRRRTEKCWEPCRAIAANIIAELPELLCLAALSCAAIVNYGLG